jgi:hypothetical protein
MKSLRRSLLHCVAVILFFTVDGARAQTSSSENSCPRSALRKYRSEVFNSLMSNKQYSQALKGLEEFLEKGRCSTSLVESLRVAVVAGETPSQDALADASELLWAESDLALALLKNDRPGDCLELLKVRADEYYFNPLSEVKNPSITKAFTVNRELCEARRIQLFPKSEVKSCPPETLPKSVSYQFSIEEQSPRSFPVQSVAQSLQLPADSGLTCVAVLKLATLQGILGDICESEAECKATDNERDSKEVVFPELFGLQSGGQKLWVRLDYTKNSWCGDPTISLHSDSKDPDSPASLLRVTSNLYPCDGGTGRVSIDTFFKVEKGALIERDQSSPSYH